MSAFTIAIEGSDGAGKATQTGMLAEHLKSCGFKVGRISFPRYNETSAGNMLFEFLKSSRAREYDFVHANPKLASRIYAQDRFESFGHLEDLIARNDFVIFDRYVESNLLHQGGKLKSDSERESFAKWLFDLEYGELELPQPRMTIYLDVPYTISIERARKRAEHKGEQLDAVELNAEYIKNSWHTGRLYAEMFGWNVVRCVVPKNDDPLDVLFELTPEEVHMKIRAIVNAKKVK